MYRRSLFLRVFSHPYVVLVFCVFVVNYVVPVGGASPSENNGKDPETNKSVLPKEDSKIAVVTAETVNSSDASSVDIGSDKAPASTGSLLGNQTLNITWLTSIKSGALERTGFVALGIMSIVLFLFIIRAIRIRRKRSKSRKYGVITSTASDMEMEPLDRGDDEEEETTLFDAQHHKYNIK